MCSDSPNEENTDRARTWSNSHRRLIKIIVTLLATLVSAVTHAVVIVVALVGAFMKIALVGVLFH